MPPEKFRVAADLDGDLAKAFNDERRKTLAPKTELVRLALVEYLRNRGHEVEEPEVEWGGYKERSVPDESEGQRVAVAVG